jgi:hypothetical protein
MARLGRRRILENAYMRKPSIFSVAGVPSRYHTNEVTTLKQCIDLLGHSMVHARRLILHDD